MRRCIGWLLAVILTLAAAVASACVNAAPTPTPAPTATTKATSTPEPTPTPLSPVSEEVSWDLANTKVYATITRPRGDNGPFPGVVFVPGSGPTDRDWNSPLLPGTNGSAKLLADSLARDGFVTIRYDKRFTGPHAQENLPLLIGKISMQGHVDELSGAVNVLTSRSDVDPSRIFVLANSEGNIHALNYQRQAKERRFAGLILAAPPGRSLGDLARSQMAAQLASLPNSDALMRAYDKAIADFVAGRPVEPDPILPAEVRIFIISLTTPANLPFTREIWEANPVKWIADVPEPILVIIGKKDIQVDWEVDGRLLEVAAAGRANVTFAYPANANHILKLEEKPREQLGAADAATYNTDGRVLDPEALSLIKSWLSANK